MPAVEFKNVDILFGNRNQQAKALTLLDAGKTRVQILGECGAVLGVADASITVEKQEICVLMGLSGSGKSTLLRAVNGLNQISRGAVFVHAPGDDSCVDVGNCSPSILRKLRMERVAMVFQQFALLPWRTVRENVGLGLELRGVAKDEIQRKVDEKLELVQLSQWADKPISQLSGGMQQRVGLARAFATDADILLMDEPFSALDPLIRNHLQDELIELQQTLNKTIIFVSHDLDEALKIGSHIAIMEEGRIVQYGTPEDIVLNPANEYVTRFVAHMNPLNVMKASSVMTPIELELAMSSKLKLEIDNNYQALEAHYEGHALTPVSMADISPDRPATSAEIITAPASIGLREIIEFRHATGNPVLLTDEQKVVGVIGDDEIYRAILRKDRC